MVFRMGLTRPSKTVYAVIAASLQMMRFLLGELLFRELAVRLRFGEICALNVSVGRSPRERRQVMRTLLSRGLEARSELNQSGFAECRSEKADTDRHTKYDARRNLNNGISRWGGQS